MFFEAEGHHREGEFGEIASAGEVRLRPITLTDLAAAAAAYRDDESTCAYLIRAASRLRTPAFSGYVLVDPSGRPLHFSWTAPFNGFFCSELDTTLDAASDLTLLFDCWTPSALRGQGHYAHAIRLLARQVQREGNRPWIFSARTNSASIEGIKRAGFHLRHSVARWRFLMWGRSSRQTFSSKEVTQDIVSAGV